VQKQKERNMQASPVKQEFPRVAQCIDRLEKLGDRAVQVCRRAIR